VINQYLLLSNPSWSLSWWLLRRLFLPVMNSVFLEFYFIIFVIDRFLFSFNRLFIFKFWFDYSILQHKEIALLVFSKPSLSNKCCNDRHPNRLNTILYRWTVCHWIDFLCNKCNNFFSIKLGMETILFFYSFSMCRENHHHFINFNHHRPYIFKIWLSFCIALKIIYDIEFCSCGKF